MYCVLIDVRGDYGIIRYEESGIESEVAMALLPANINIGDRLKFEDFEFIII